MHKQTPKQAAYLFFLRNAGASWVPAVETKQQGMARNARKLAKAERDARALGYTFEWEYDSDGCIGSICEPSREYRRVIEAELALEELGK